MAAATFTCCLCRRKHPVFEAGVLDNCCCLFCTSCLAEYIKTALESCALARKEFAFQHQYQEGIKGLYIDDDGSPLNVEIVEKRWKSAWDKSEITVKLLNTTKRFTTGYWRIFFDPGSTCTRTSSTLQLNQSFGHFSCPHSRCSGLITKSEAQEYCKNAFESYLESETITQSFRQGFIRCPGCGCLIERLQDIQFLRRLSSRGITPQQHGDNYRFRCAHCQHDFCGICLTTPYHTGLTCRQQKLPNCRFCDQKLDAPLHLNDEFIQECELDKMPLRKVRNLVKAYNINSAWCLEKTDFVWVARCIASVCRTPDCQFKLMKSCTKKLPCGHRCCGISEHRNYPQYRHYCLPCFESGCPHARTELDGCPICWESFSSNLTIQLNCNHLIHLDCARQRLEKGYPGPSISFNHLYCSMCGNSGEKKSETLGDSIPRNSLYHPLLEPIMKPILNLRKQVFQLALERLKMNGNNRVQELQPGGSHEGRPLDYALSQYLFFLCYKCKKPYYGGRRQCQAAADNEEDYDPKDLLCGNCSIIASGNVCPQHGNSCIEWKCKYCCNLASWYCWGTTHMCNSCHSATNRRNKVHQCLGSRCPLKIPHPPPGQEFCLGCALCHRHYD